MSGGGGAEGDAVYSAKQGDGVGRARVEEECEDPELRYCAEGGGKALAGSSTTRIYRER